MKKIVITGASGNIGTEITKYFYNKYHLICLDKNLNTLKVLKKKFPKIEIYKLDLNNLKNLSTIIKKITKKNKQIDILINNAGKIFSNPIIRFKAGKIEKHSFKDWEEVIKTNLTSTFNISSFLIENMVANRNPGLIINISSIASEGNEGQSAYSAAKAGINALTFTWAKELSRFNIRVAGISPGFFSTESTYKSINKSHINHIKENTPSKRLGKLSELIHGIDFIIKNKFFNGKILKIDGGLKI